MMWGTILIVAATAGFATAMPGRQWTLEFDVPGVIRELAKITGLGNQLITRTKEAPNNVKIQIEVPSLQSVLRYIGSDKKEDFNNAMMVIRDEFEKIKREHKIYLPHIKVISDIKLKEKKRTNRKAGVDDEPLDGDKNAQSNENNIDKNAQGNENDGDTNAQGNENDSDKNAQGNEKDGGNTLDNESFTAGLGQNDGHGRGKNAGHVNQPNAPYFILYALPKLRKDIEHQDKFRSYRRGGHLDNTIGGYKTYPEIGPGMFKMRLKEYPPYYHQNKVRALLEIKARNEKLKGRWKPGI